MPHLHFHVHLGTEQEEVSLHYLIALLSNINAAADPEEAGRGLCSCILLLASSERVADSLDELSCSPVASLAR